MKYWTSHLLPLADVGIGKLPVEIDVSLTRMPWPTIMSVIALCAIFNTSAECRSVNLKQVYVFL